jgi:hypothetical protein
LLLEPVTATDDLLGAEKWGAGPTAVALKQQNGWTYGALANHIWSFAGESGRADVNATYLQPFVSYTTKTATTFTLNTESTYDWEDEQWTVPLNLMVSAVGESRQTTGRLDRGRSLLRGSNPTTARSGGYVSPSSSCSRSEDLDPTRASGGNEFLENLSCLRLGFLTRFRNLPVPRAGRFPVRL